ncbi:hypothetical protein FTV88_0220 [Heliorestis convoluta]|uniref:Uncharacterized protein n=1 Tax=Heliorestis convoluta TaxID=356322 RepID=A0A5Q2MYF9_9FIRM|nr:hypothetical protein FTV88_0220 [Heliorestis convoluta]
MSTHRKAFSNIFSSKKHGFSSKKRYTAAQDCSIIPIGFVLFLQ